jgi:hypothetical protein
VLYCWQYSSGVWTYSAEDVHAGTHIKTNFYDALSYFHDHRDDIGQELLENTEEHGRAYLREHLGEAGYLRVTGQSR